MNEKVLKALYELRSRMNYQIALEGKTEVQEEWDTIEKELKEKEQYEEILNDYGLTLANFREACLFYAWLKSEKLNFDNGAKKLKALNILKKYIDITFFFSNYEITEEDYDLLKEVL